MSAMHLSTLVLSLLGFLALALATERHAEHLLRRTLAPGQRRLARVSGWLLLALALALCVSALGVGVGITVWLGWLTVAALIWVFSFPKWPWQPQVKTAPERKPRAARAAQDAPEPVSPTGRRRLAVGLLVATVGVFAVALWRVDPMPLQRDDALQGTVGPWSYILAEADRKAPEIVDMGIPLKAFRLRFCETCDQDIRHAYLKVNKPRSLRASGMAFEGARWERRVEIQLPANLTADSELWLTVVGKDGSVHQTGWPMSSVSPASVRWFERQRQARAQ